MKKILLDTDAGVDDVMAILLLLRCPDLAECVGITVVAGNTNLEHCLANVRRALGIAGLYTDGLTASIGGIPVLAGAARPLSRPLLHAIEVHGPDGLGGTSTIPDPSGALLYPERPVPLHPLPAHRFMLDAAVQAPGEITLVAIGPLTNVALACLEDPVAFREFKEIILMGGAFHHDGNASARAEFNILVDPEAARIVLDSGVPVKMVPLDCTEQTRLIESDLEGDGPVHAFLRAATSTIMGFYRRFEGFEGIYHHDPLAMGVALDPSFAFGMRTRVEVETRGEYSTGETVAALRRQRALLEGEPNVEICLHADAERFNRFFLDRVLPAGA
ncbi:MAG TPA: nucleoside hydrolase [Armatimonadota bacterium]